MRPVRAFSAALLATLAISVAAPAQAAQCNHPSGFDGFLAEFRKEAAAAGLNQKTLSLLNGVTLDESVLRADRRQGVFKQSFEEFALPRIKSRFAKASRMMSEHAPTLRRIEKEFGVPGAMVIVLWGLETDFGTHTGKHEVLRATATLGFDCRRSAFFQNELMEALTLVQKGDLTPADLRGDWAGELGQAHFLPSSYNKFAIDFDGNGKRDLIRSVPDTLASIANYFKGYGWKPGQSWAEGTENFEVIRKWNKALVYAKTVAAFAEQLEGRNARAEQNR
jgi:lytic murein transglycosylase